MFLLNGQSADSIDILDRGLHYGDGLFETLAVVNQQPLCLDKHLQRLLSGCERLGIDFNDVDPLTLEIASLCKHVEKAVLKITITGGVGSRGYQRSGSESKPTRLLAIVPWPEYPDNYSSGIHAYLCNNRLGHNPRLAGMKHLNRLEQVLARNEWDDADIMEGLVLDINGHVIGGTMSNLFVVDSDNKLITPAISQCGIAGIVRQYLLDHSVGLAYSGGVKKVSMDDIYHAREIFFCNSIAGIMPVKQLLGHVFETSTVTNEIQQFLISQKVIAS